MKTELEYVKQKLGEDSFWDNIVSILTFGLGGFILNEVYKRKAEEEARKRDCLCAFRTDVFPLPCGIEAVHVWKLYDRNHNTGKYNIDTGIEFTTVTGGLECHGGQNDLFRRRKNYEKT